jgi:hypothetical protein
VIELFIGIKSLVALDLENLLEIRVLMQVDLFINTRECIIVLLLNRTRIELLALDGGAELCGRLVKTHAHAFYFVDGKDCEAGVLLHELRFVAKIEELHKGRDLVVAVFKLIGVLNCSENIYLGVAPQVCLEEPSQLGVSHGHMDPRR